MNSTKIVLIQCEFKHDAVRSNYNSNFYNHKKLGYTVHEICHEDYDFQEFYLIEDDGHKTFLGCSKDGFGDGDKINIDFKVFYT